MKEREDRIAEKRRQQPREELVRKWNKAQGRHSKHYWSQETIDLVYVDAREPSEPAAVRTPPEWLRELLKLRERAIGEGMPLLSANEINEEVAQRRGFR
jgi:hypothetical protein